MKKVQITIALLFITTVSFGQWFIGNTFDQVKTDVSTSLEMTNLKTETDDDGFITLIAADETCIMHYGFDAKKKCKISLIKPLNQYVKDIILKEIADHGKKLPSNKFDNLWLFNEAGTYLYIIYYEDKELGYFTAEIAKKESTL